MSAPGARFLRVDEREGERADAERRRHLDRVPVRAGHPHRRMRRLHGFGQHVAAGHFEILALEARIGVHDHHVGDLLARLDRHGALFLRGNREAAEFEARRALADAEVDAPVRHDVERRQPLGRARGVIVVRDHLADAVAEANALRARGGGGEEHFRRGGMRVFVEEVMLDLPGVVVAEPVGELDLGERLVEQAALVARSPRLGELHFVEDAEFHGRASMSRWHSMGMQSGWRARCTRQCWDPEVNKDGLFNLLDCISRHRQE